MPENLLAQNAMTVALPAGALAIELQKQQLWLLPERGIFWPREKVLIIADVHLGKETVFQRSGLAIPHGPSETSLARLAVLLNQLQPRTLLVLGDLVHALPKKDECWIAVLQQLLDAHPGTEVQVVTGNHDKPGVASRLPGALGWHQELAMQPFHFYHEPVALPAPAQRERSYGICGHLHPALVLHDGGLDRLRMPVFWLSAAQLVLPAFGEFTGTHCVKPGPGDRVYGVGPDVVIALR